ncbi:MAG: helix-turn-helix transcriptional regulator [Nocardioides sp.]|nr:helix-turn-helix transcriptional regulator [Nocardioides sp.]
MADFDDVLDAVGPRLRTLRLDLGATLAELAESTGISISTLSRLESGRRRPSLELLLPLARVHQVPLDELVDAPETGDPRVHVKAITKHGATIVPLTRRPGGVRAFKQVLPPGWPAGSTCGTPGPQSHEGYEWMYVLSGTIRLLLGSRDILLSAGEVVEFDTRTPHLMSNPGPHPAEMLCLYGPPGERMHVRSS